MDLLSLSVLGPSSSASAGDKLESSEILPTKAVNPATSHPSSSEFAEFKDQVSSRFTKLEALLATAGALPGSAKARYVFLSCQGRSFTSTPSRVVSTTPFILQPSPLTSVTTSGTPGILFNCLYQLLVQLVQLTRDLELQALCLVQLFYSTLPASTTSQLVPTTTSACLDGHHKEPVFSTTVGSVT